MWNVKSRGLLRATPGSWQVGGRLVSLCAHSFRLPEVPASCPPHGLQQSPPTLASSPPSDFSHHPALEAGPVHLRALWYPLPLPCLRTRWPSWPHRPSPESAPSLAGLLCVLTATLAEQQQHLGFPEASVKTKATPGPSWAGSRGWRPWRRGQAE